MRLAKFVRFGLVFYGNEVFVVVLFVVFLLVILTASAIRNLKDVNSSMNPEAQATETDEILGAPF